MGAKQNERIKLYLVVVLACVLMAIVYMRFVRHGSVVSAPEHTADAAVPPAVVEVPDVAPESLGPGPGTTGSVMDAGTIRDPVRDVFAPGDLPVVQGAQGAPARESLSSLELRGVVMGGGTPVALINDRFVRAGDRIGPYRVLRIDPKEVWLDSGIETHALRLMKEK